MRPAKRVSHGLRRGTIDRIGNDRGFKRHPLGQRRSDGILVLEGAGAVVDVDPEPHPAGMMQIRAMLNSPMQRTNDLANLMARPRVLQHGDEGKKPQPVCSSARLLARTDWGPVGAQANSIRRAR